MLRGIAYYIAFTIGAGPATAQEWAHTWGGGQSDSVSSVATDAAGNVYLAGATSSFGAGGSDVLLLKYDTTGNLLWSRTWGGSADEGASGIAIDASGNVYVAGSTTSFGAGWADAVLLKFDGSGDLLWSRTWGGPSFDVAYDVAFDASGNVYVAAESYSLGNSAVLLKFDSNGDLLSVRSWKGPASYDSAYSVDVDKNGNVVLAGISWDYSVSPNHNSILILKFDNKGNLLWNKNLVSGAEDEAHGAKVVRFDGSGNIFIAGHRASVCQSADFSTCNFDVELVKLDPNGSLIWAQSWGGNGFESVGGLAFDQSGNLIVTGTSASFLSGTNAAMLLKLDDAGRLLQSQVWGGEGGAGASGVAVDSAGAIIFGGSAPNASGGWEVVTGSVTTPSPSLTSPSGSAGTSMLGLGTPRGLLSSPVGVPDTGGGKMDALAVRTTLAPAVSVGSVVSAANYATTVAPGSIAASFGNFLLSSTAEPQATPLPVSLLGLSMQFGSGTKAPLFYVSSSQINLQVPWELAGQSQVPVTATVNGQTSAPRTANIVPFSPGIFTMNGQGTGQGAILDASYRLVDASNPAMPGSTALQIFCTGLGPVTNQPTSGSPAPSNPLAETPTSPTVTIGGVPAKVLFSGLAPGSVGEYQVNALVPATTLAGSAVPVSISIGGATSNIATIAVTGPTGTGTLDVQITGLPAGTPVNVSITSTNGYSTTITTASASLQVPSGTYTITASPVAAGNLSYYASAQQTVNVAPGATANAQIAYDTVIPNTTKVLDQTGTTSLTVASDGSTLTMSAQSAVAASLAPGDVLAAAPTPVAPHGLLRKIVSIAQAAGQVTATTTQAALTDAIQQANLQFSANLLPQNVTSATALLPGVEVRVGTRPAAARTSPAGQPAAALPMDASDICANGQVVLTEMKQVEIASGLNVSGEIELCGNFTIQGGINWLGLQLNSLTAAATLAEHTDLSVTGQSVAFSGTQTIATIEFSDIVILVGGIPLDFAPQIAIQIGASGAAGASFSAGVSQNTSVTRGFSYANGQVSPVLQSTPLTFQLEPLTVTSNKHLTATAFVEADIDLLLYHIAGPYFDPQAYIQFDADVLQNPWWTLSGGVKGPVGLQLNPDLDVLGFDNLPTVSFADLFDISLTFLQASSGFPSLQALTPNAAPSGSPGLTLTVAGSNFVTGSTVSFGGAPLATTFVNPSELTAAVPASDLASAGAFPVTVSNPSPGGGTSDPLTFTVTVQVANPQPIIASLSPPAASVGSGPLTVTINGSGFIASSTVTFNGAPHAATFVNSGQLTITLTASDLGAVGTFAVIVSNPGVGGGPSNAATFTVQAAGNPQPTITSLSPPSASAGSGPLTLTINGSGFIASSTVTFNGVSHRATFVSSGQLTIALTASDLASVGSVAVVVSNPAPGGGASNAAAFAVQPPGAPAPVITEYPVPTAGSWPDGIATGPDGALWFTELHANNIGRITTTGAVTEYPVSAFPVGIAAGPDGALWFAEFGGKIGRITTAGTVTEYPVPTPASGPNGIAAGPDGALWFTEASTSEVVNGIGRITTSGVVTEYPVPTPHSAPEWITAGPDGALWFTELNGNNIGRITTAGAITEYPVPTADSHPAGITTGPDGAVWFAEGGSHKIGRITTAGVITEYPAPAGAAAGPGITVGPDGALWFGGVGRITTTGVASAYPGVSPSSFPYGITAGPDGALWFAEYYGNQIGRVGLDPSSIVTPTLQGLWLSSTAVTSGSSFTGTVTLTGPAPAGGVKITIQDSPAILQVNSPITILAGQTTGTFTISAPVVASSTTVTITANLAGSTSVSASLVISPAASASPFQNSGFDIYGTLDISGQSVPVEVQTLPLSDGTLGVISNSSVSLTIEIEMLFDEQFSVSGSTLTYSGADPVASSFLNLSTLALYTSFTSATLSLSVPSPTVGAAVTGALQFTSSGASLSGTITGTISTVSGP